MATKSISKNVKINSNASGVRLAKALEKSSTADQTNINISKKINRITDTEKIKTMFKD